LVGGGVGGRGRSVYTVFMHSKSVRIFNTINGQMDRFLPVLPPLGLLLGFLLPGVFIHLRSYVSLLFAMMTLSGALKIRIVEFSSTIRSPFPILVSFFSAHIAMPLFTLLCTSFLFRGDNETITGFILLYCGPIAVSSFIWVTIYNGNKALSLMLILLGTLSAPLLVPGTISLLMGARVVINISGIAISLVLMVVIPTIVGVTLNETSRGKIPDRICPYLNPVSKICLMLVIAANTAPLAAMIRFDDPFFWKLAGVNIMLMAGNFMLAKLAGILTKCNPEKSIALFFSGSLRNFAAIATIAVTFFPEAVSFPIILAILLQHSISALMAKLVIRKMDN